jgi:hypothetical protein
MGIEIYRLDGCIREWMDIKMERDEQTRTKWTAGYTDRLKDEEAERGWWVGRL